MAQFRNNEMVPEDPHVGGQPGTRRMSITNAMDILRERLLRAIKRKQVRENRMRFIIHCGFRLRITRTRSGQSLDWSTLAKCLSSLSRGCKMNKPPFV